ncbi:hypothetical protein VYU27_007402 [Nannochloropsis oceanica]
MKQFTPSTCPSFEEEEKSRSRRYKAGHRRFIGYKGEGRDEDEDESSDDDDNESSDDDDNEKQQEEEPELVNLPVLLRGASQNFYDG